MSNGGVYLNAGDVKRLRFWLIDYGKKLWELSELNPNYRISEITKTLDGVQSFLASMQERQIKKPKPLQDKNTILGREVKL